MKTKHDRNRTEPIESPEQAAEAPDESTAAWHHHLGARQRCVVAPAAPLQGSRPGAVLGPAAPLPARPAPLVSRRRALSLACCAGLGLLISSGTARAAQPLQQAPDDDRLPVVITAGTDHAVKHWDASGRLLGGIGMHVDAVPALAYAQGELVCAVNDGKLKGVNLSTGKTDFEVKAHPEGAIAISLATDGSLLATGGADSAIRLWDGKSGRFLTLLAKAHGGPITTLQLTSDHTHLVTGSVDHLIRVWHIAGDAKHPTIEYKANFVAHDDAVTAISVSGDDKLIASVSGDGSLKVWNLASGALVQRMRLGAAGLAVVFSPDSHTIATGAADGKIRLWNPDSGMALPFMGAHERGVTALAWTPDGKLLVSGGEDKTLRYWDVATGRQIARITAHDGAVRAIVLP